MRKMRQVNLNLNFLIFIILCVAVARFQSRNTEPGRGETPTARAPTAVPPFTSVVAKMESPKPATAPAATVIPNPKAAAPVQAKVETAFSKELSEYAVLKKKVFLTPAEDAAKKELIGSERVLRGMRIRLLRTPENAREAADQNAAIDMLLDAVRVGNSEVAVDVLRSVVTDGQIEDETIDFRTRENLAGVKAEVLYQWSALRPAQADELAELLPGPVSEKIWRNVVDAQASNLSESAALTH